MVSAANTGSTLSLDNGTNKTSVGLSTNILILVNGRTVGAVQELSVNEQRTINMVAEVGTDGHVDSAPTKSTEISGRCRRVRLDNLRVSEAFSRGFIHIASQIYPFDIVIVDRSKRDVGSQISTVIKNVWIEGISYSYSADNWIITEEMSWKAESIFSVLNGGRNPAASGSAQASVAVGGELGIIHSNILAGDNGGIQNIEQVVDTGGQGRRGSMDAGGLIDLAVGNILF